MFSRLDSKLSNWKLPWEKQGRSCVWVRIMHMLTLRVLSMLCCGVLMLHVFNPLCTAWCHVFWYFSSWVYRSHRFIYMLAIGSTRWIQTKLYTIVSLSHTYMPSVCCGCYWQYCSHIQMCPFRAGSMSVDVDLNVLLCTCNTFCSFDCQVSTVAWDPARRSVFFTTVDTVWTITMLMWMSRDVLSCDVMSCAATLHANQLIRDAASLAQQLFSCVWRCACWHVNVCRYAIIGLQSGNIIFYFVGEYRGEQHMTSSICRSDEYVGGGIVKLPFCWDVVFVY